MLTSDARRGNTVITLSDELRHPLFAWPTSLVEVEVGPGTDGPTRLVGENGAQVAHQVNDGTLSFLSDLPTGTARRWTLEPGVADPDTKADAVSVVGIAGGVIVTNGPLRLTVSQTGDTVISLESGNRPLMVGTVAHEAFVGREIEVRRSGPVVAKVALTFTTAGGSTYELAIRVVSGEDVVRFSERFDPVAGDTTADSRLELHWSGFEATHRWSPNRPDLLKEPKEWERADAGIHNNRMLPIRLMPFHNWQSWWRHPEIVFWSEHDRSMPVVGILIGDVTKWKDGRYALWGSAPDLGVTFRLGDHGLEWTFPLPSAREWTRETFVLCSAIPEIEPQERGSRAVQRMQDALRWQSWIPLQKVAGWHLDHLEPRGSYPRAISLPEARYGTTEQQAANLLTWLTSDQAATDGTVSEAPTISGIATGGPRSRPGPAPVAMREIKTVLWPHFDSTAAALSEDDLRLASATLQFLAHVSHDEWLMPVRTMLAGHPNFLADVLTGVAILPILFPNHPDADRMADYVEQVIAMNARRHTRPSVASWGSAGGRWTENLGAYLFAYLKPTVAQSAHLRRTFDGRNRLAPAEFGDLTRWIIGSLSVPLRRYDGRRVLPGAGAHSAGGPPARIFRVLGTEMRRLDPVLSEHVLWAAPPNDKDNSALEALTADHAGLLSAEDNAEAGTPPQLQSAAYTGYGVVLRAGVGAPDEVAITLHQIDEGPNYRWGRAGRGGNGVLSVYAAGERWSHHGAEHVGDGLYGDVEYCTNFGVRAPGGYRDIGEYRSIGRGDLSGALIDTGVAVSARVVSSGKLASLYAAREVVLAGTDYLIVHDDVRDPSAEGRFSWFVDIDQEFPAIHQLLPGASFVEVEPPAVAKEMRGQFPRAKGRYYDGLGTFLTIVSFREDLTATVAPHGATVRVGDQIDHVIQQAEPITTVLDDGVHLTARSAVSRHRPDHLEVSMLSGTRIAIPGVEISVAGTIAVGLVRDGAGTHGWLDVQSGSVRIAAALPLAVDGDWATAEEDGTYELHLARGRHTWQLTDADPTPLPPVIHGFVRGRDDAIVRLGAVPGANGYLIERSLDGCETWTEDAQGGTELPIAVAPPGTKAHIRARARRGNLVGPASAPYPLPGLVGSPPPPDGVVATVDPAGIRLSWGEVLGVATSRVYRRAGDDKLTLVAEVEGRELALDRPAEVTEYLVTSVDGWGEGEPSAAYSTRMLDTELGLLLPTQKFTRATESFECGYPEYDPWIEGQMPILDYPED